MNIELLLVFLVLIFLIYYLYSKLLKYPEVLNFKYKPDYKYDFIDIIEDNIGQVEKIKIRSNEISESDGWIPPINRKYFRDFYFDGSCNLRQVDFYECINEKPFEKVIFEYNSNGNLIYEKRLLKNGKTEVCKYSYRWFFNCLSVKKSDSDDVEKFYFKNKELYKKKFIQKYKIFDEHRKKIDVYFLKEGQFVNDDDFYNFLNNLDIENESKSIYEYNENNDWILKRQSINENLEQEIKREIFYI